MSVAAISSFVIWFISATIRMATPLVLATIGETFAERSGILNLGIEGTMLMGALTGFLVTYFTKSLWLGVLMAAVVGLLFGLLMAFFAVTLGVNQHVSGLGITIFATGLAYYTYRAVIGSPTVPPSIKAFSTLKIPLLWKIPVLGPIFFNQYALTYIAFLLVPLSSYVIFKTTFGLSLRAVGENPESADAVGINVYKIRYISMIIAGTLMGIAGSFFTLCEFNMFLYNIVGGRGWVAIALVIFANWMPWKVLGGALFFGGIDVLGLRLQSSAIKIPYQIYLMLPYLFTIIVLILVARNASYPAALLKPYRRE
jgi:simple sugar transport system permease protein